jgi:transposase
MWALLPHRIIGELQALGHTVRLMPPAYVKPYVKRRNNDATDAEAICEAVARANMRFVRARTTLDRPPGAFISSLIPSVSCRQCSPNASFTALDALTAERP